jgi:hypothetical protein
MPIPEFDDQTGYLPAGDHSASLDEMEQRFCGTFRRREIFKELKHVVEQLEAKGVDNIASTRERPGCVGPFVAFTQEGSKETTKSRFVEVTVSSTHTRKAVAASDN